MGAGLMAVVVEDVFALFDGLARDEPLQIAPQCFSVNGFREVVICYVVRVVLLLVARQVIVVLRHDAQFFFRKLLAQTPDETRFSAPAPPTNADYVRFHLVRMKIW
jgi:hypothetical protein